jgi:CRP-like cAMP-binding protein
MLTIDDVAAVPLFSALPAIELERLARTSADIHLSSGEFAVHEGGEPALFAVLSGKIEVIKTIDGVERGLGWRIPGAIFGEVPITLGTSFPGGYRAAEPSRVMQIDLQQYYEIVAVSQDILRQVAALARERLGGLQSIAAEPHKPRVTVVGQRWDQACSHLRRFLARNQVSFTWLTPDAPELANLWPGTPRTTIGPLRGSPTERRSFGQNCEILQIASVFKPARALPNTTSRSSAGDRPAWPRLYMARPKGCARLWLSVKPPADRRGHRRGLRIISDSPTASRATNLPAEHSSKLDGSGRKSLLRAPSQASI